MKNNIKSLIDAVIHDNKQFIAEGGSQGNVMLYLHASFLAEDQGHCFYLTDEEITEWENDSDREMELRQEIVDFLRENYNYSILTYDVHFNDAHDSNSKGFSSSLEDCRNYIDINNGI